MYGCESNYLYAIKCLFKDSPMLLIGIVFICSILIFATSLRIAERDVQRILNSLNSDSQGGSQKAGTNDISDFSNALWLTIITMTTVGYGDYYPRTTFGRVIDVILVVWGTFVVSLMVVVLTNTLNMDPS
jgi:potassium intermediate/small conductance calcium-activated channel subfamily N protein 2